MGIVRSAAASGATDSPGYCGRSTTSFAVKFRFQLGTVANQNRDTWLFASNPSRWSPTAHWFSA